MLAIQAPFQIAVEYWLMKPNFRVGVTLRIVNEQNIVVFTTGTGDDPSSPRNQDSPSGLYRSVVEIPSHLLNSGNYNINLLIVVRSGRSYKHDNIVSLKSLTSQITSRVGMGG